MSCRLTPLARLAVFARHKLVRCFIASVLCFASGQAIATITTPSLTPTKMTPAKPAEHPEQIEPEQDPVAEIYRHAGATLLWSAFGQPRENAFNAIELLANAGEQGIDPERYATSTLYDLIVNLETPAELLTFDRLLTTAVWTFNEDLRRGHNPAHRKAQQPARVADAVLSALADAITQDQLAKHLEAHIPRFENYRQLQQTLETYRDYQRLDGWSVLPADMRLKPGDTHSAIPALRQRLAMTDNFQDSSPTSETFDVPLQEAVMHFQSRHQLLVDGHVGPATLARLNVTVEDKIRWVSLNLARLRALPPELPDDHLQVNIPEFELRLFRDNIETLNMGVVVGSRRNPTPPMQDRLRHLVFNPYWYPTRRITVNEILPRLKRDPEYLQRSQFEMLERESKTVVDSTSMNWQNVNARRFPYRFRQIPGEKNSLGQVKFIFPNRQSIYLHDTPSRDLFKERVRAFSHGCVRVEKPTELATQLMEWDRGWTEAEVLADIDAEKRKLRKFQREMDIYLLYQTVAVRDNRVNFYPDIYRHDRSRGLETPYAPAIAARLNGSSNLGPALSSTHPSTPPTALTPARPPQPDSLAGR